jgi:2'-5' RNA ligase
MLPNWFVAIPVPAEPWFHRFITPPPQAFRRFHPDDLHMTVAFLGPVGEDRARSGWQAMQWPLQTITTTLGTIIPMGAPHRYSALSVELVQSREIIEDALAQCRDAISDAAGAKRENRPPKAHITVARPSRRATAGDRADGLRWAKRIDLHQHPMTLDSVALYTWDEDRRERQFRIVARTP